MRDFRDLAEKPPPAPLVPAEPAWSTKLESSVSAAAVMDDAHVYVALRDQTLLALGRESGVVAWRRADEAVLSMAAGGGELFIVTTDRLRALDAVSGR